jgi:hypothetical protein
MMVDQCGSTSCFTKLNNDWYGTFGSLRIGETEKMAVISALNIFGKASAKEMNRRNVIGNKRESKI